jgi:hypothetical protein
VRMKAARAPTQTAQDRSLEKITCSYFGPLRRGCRQFDAVSVILPKTPHQTSICRDRKSGRGRNHPVTRYAVGKKAQPVLQQRFETILSRREIVV